MKIKDIILKLVKKKMNWATFSGKKSISKENNYFLEALFENN